MKNIYNISKGQFIVVWIFGVIFWIQALNDYGDFWAACVTIVPAVLAFYTIGWNANHKK